MMIDKLFISVLLMTSVAANNPPPSNQAIQDAQRQVQQLKNLIQEPQLQWNHYETKNFDIFSIDDKQGSYLAKNIENIKTWIFFRWGVNDVGFRKRCKVMCVPNKELFVKLFGKDSSSMAVEKGAIWIITDTDHWHTSVLAPLMTEACLVEFESFYKVQFGAWSHRGMTVLNGTPSDIRIVLSSFEGKNYIASKEMLSITLDVYAKMSTIDKARFDIQSAAFCLLIRKEIGAQMFLDYVDQSRVDPERALAILHFADYKSLDGSLSSYLSNMVHAIQQGQVPASYLTW